ncbi:hypothetical protein P154DRAFT_16511 [Amniculicola lignicola CBS 123094]|uniref:Uncharacterized protein n=1 Tax=Amniculicola lignicola CBS 123094 TaxID=1392246 RepID=A0A6A5X5M9_9PLEO|nr:hypothetical protein P154DRAFT_16511 [Amniculicola lignicola CBS 123094]
MRSLLTAACLALVVSGARISRQPREDSSWSYLPDKTADWYQEHQVPLPELAPEITTVREGKSYIVKLECIGCLFRVRELGEPVEKWQFPSQENSLLLNFTVDDTDAALYLNGQRAAPLAPLPADISAFQTPANLSAETMGKMVRQNMLDRSWALGTKYGQFELEYEHALLETEVMGNQWLQFDIKAIHIRQSRNSGGYRLKKEGQKMVQMLLRQQIQENVRVMTINDISIIAHTDEKELKKPIMMPCGKPAVVRTSFNPLEWDYYGQFGTATRAWHKIYWGTGEMLWGSRFLIIITIIAAGSYSIVQCCVRRSRAATKLIGEDAEAALLGDEDEAYDEPPSTYELTSQSAEVKEEDTA